MPRTCVIIVSYRGASDTAACVRALLGSSVSPMIIVVDSTPNDSELEAAIAFAPDVVVLRAPRNLGFGGSNNLGIRWALSHTDCEFFFFLNNDAFVSPDSIQAIECAFDTQPTIAAATARIVYFDDPATLWYGGGEIDWRRASAFTPGFDQSSEAELALRERDVGFASGCALAMRRSALERLKGFDERFFMYEEDVELCLRMSSFGLTIRYLPSCLILHRAQGSRLSINPDRAPFWSVKNPSLTFYAFHVIRNRLLVAYLHAHGINRLIVIFFFPLFLIRRAIPFLLGGRFDAIHAMFRGIVDFWLTARKTPLRVVGA